ncbi:MAG: DotI/IcmL family type IV secretion protein [Gammaproteobacteria bacterium]|nr:DotI/IcmL family type IV secretion protein [Gammaproteobacteria bacterium]
MRIFILIVMAFWSILAKADPTAAQLSIWSNEALISIYTYDYQHYLSQQRAIARYFTLTGWTDYSKALIAAGVPKSVQDNHFTVSSVALEPPEVAPYEGGMWKAQMPILVVYKNAQVEQKQRLIVTIYFKEVPTGGMQGLAIERLQSIVKDPPCSCDL